MRTSAPMTHEELARHDARRAAVTIRAERAYVLRIVALVLGDWAVALIERAIEAEGRRA